MAYMVIVWEWMNEFGNWRPYDPHVSDFLEDKYKNQPLNPVSLGHVDSSLAVYSADFTTMCQIRFGTGTARPIRRQLYPDTSPPGKGVVWQWEGDQAGQWHNYDLKVSTIIEDYFSQNTSALGSFDLSKTSLKLPYILDLGNMTQKRIETGRVRQLRREVLNSQYTMMSAAKTSGQSASTSPTCPMQGTKRPNGAISGPSGTKKARYAYVKSGASSQSGNLSMGQHINQGQVVSQLLAGSNTNPQSTNGPVTRSRLQTMTNSQCAPVQQGRPSIPLSVGQGQGQSHGNQQQMQQHSTSTQSMQNTHNIAQYARSSATHHPQYIQLTSHNILNPRAVQFLSQLGSLPPGANIPSVTVNLHGNSQGISMPGSLLGRSKGASRISPVVNNATNVPTFPLPTSSGGGITHFNLPHSDRIPNNAPKAKKDNSGRSSSCDTLDEHTTVVTNPSGDEDCCICCEKLNQPSGYGEGKSEASIVLKLEKCSHMFHKLCLQAMYESGAKNGCLQCPTCKTIHGEKHGNCPPGIMEYHRLPQQLPSYEGCQTIQILYQISPGVQGPEHPHPGRRYSCRGFPRVCYLPDNDKGRKDCCICCEKLNQPSGYGEGKSEASIVLKLEKCSHMFHKLCLQAMYESGAKNGCLQCPTCKTIHGEKHGNCPPGIMEYHRLPQQLPSYEGCQTIQILYQISPGVQGPEHPHPGRRYSCRGFPRVCYLPDNDKGRKVLKLLTVAWKRRLTFTIGMSTTTGEGDTVTWNEIHHKTEFGSNRSGHGYPDPNYLDNVLMELAIQGVTESDL